MLKTERGEECAAAALPFEGTPLIQELAEPGFRIIVGHATPLREHGVESRLR